jgi:ketosteroid isomerase-like protein
MMRHKWVARACLAIIIFAASPPVYGQDLDALKASFAAEITALDTKNLAAAVAQAHDDIVLFGVFSPFPIVGKAAFQRAVQEYFSQHETATFMPLQPEFSIIGTAGVAWGEYKMALTLKGGSVAHSLGRYIFSYVQADGKWQLLSMHISPLRK